MLQFLHELFRYTFTTKIVRTTKNCTLSMSIPCRTSHTYRLWKASPSSALDLVRCHNLSAACALGCRHVVEQTQESRAVPSLYRARDTEGGLHIWSSSRACNRHRECSENKRISQQNQKIMPAECRSDKWLLLRFKWSTAINHNGSTSSEGCILEESRILSLSYCYYPILACFEIWKIEEFQMTKDLHCELYPKKYN